MNISTVWSLAATTGIAKNVTPFFMLESHLLLGEQQINYQCGLGVQAALQADDK
ncbi:MAG: hypothetical protein ACK2UW_20100 [Anaerolineales bacterium]